MILDIWKFPWEQQRSNILSAVPCFLLFSFGGDDLDKHKQKHVGKKVTSFDKFNRSTDSHSVMSRQMCASFEISCK